MDVIKRKLYSKNVKQINFVGKEEKNSAQKKNAAKPILYSKNVKHIVRRFYDIGTILLTGYSPKELNKMPDFNKLKQKTYVIIAGRYKQHLNLQKAICGSSNKELMVFSSFYELDEFNDIPPTEIIVQSDSSLVITGIQPNFIEDVPKNN